MKRGHCRFPRAPSSPVSPFFVPATTTYSSPAPPINSARNRTCPLCVRHPVHFACEQICWKHRIHAQKWCLSSKLPRPSYIFSLLLLRPRLHHSSFGVSFVVNASYSNSLPKLLTLQSFLPYNTLAFDSHGLIRRLGRLLSDLVHSLSLILFAPVHMLSFEMSSVAGVTVSRRN